jgi:cell division protein FtsN
VGRGNFNKIIPGCINIFAGSKLSSRVLSGDVQSNPPSPSVVQLPPSEHKPLDTVAASSSNVSPAEVKTDPVSSSNIEEPPNDQSLLGAVANSSANLSSEELKTDNESFNIIQTSNTESKQEGQNGSRNGSRTKEIAVAKKKDCIFSLAQKHYHVANGTLVDLILQSNPEIENIHFINVNQKIKIPEITAESPIIELPNHTYEIHLGTFLTKILAEAYKQGLSLEGKRLEIIPLRVSPGETWYRVIAGKFDARDDCLKVIAMLKEKVLLPIFEGKQDTRRFRNVSLRP